MQIVLPDMTVKSTTALATFIYRLQQKTAQVFTMRSFPSTVNLLAITRLRALSSPRRSDCLGDAPIPVQTYLQVIQQPLPQIGHYL
jgi:hypothetical protein